eukprot:TRINITY_DN37871_c0_g1_i1.p1 TRINITY_DN37871_c0_g1~~TRINITY_DN37871_c0_g1_i1.p1  ORF type:complete len:271 (+),score=61.23 TRINITY_DN37871_c0_g1_i1:107-814(+)
MLRSLVGSEMCIRDRYQRRVRGLTLTLTSQSASMARNPPRILRPLQPVVLHPSKQAAEQQELQQIARVEIEDGGWYRLSSPAGLVLYVEGLPLLESEPVLSGRDLPERASLLQFQCEGDPRTGYRILTLDGTCLHATDTGKGSILQHGHPDQPSNAVFLLEHHLPDQRVVLETASGRTVYVGDGEGVTAMADGAPCRPGESPTCAFGLHRVSEAEVEAVRAVSYTHLTLPTKRIV